MKHKLATTSLAVVALVISTTLASFSVATKAAAAPPNDPDTPLVTWPINGDCPNLPGNEPGSKPPCASDNVILKWNDELLQAIRANPGGTGPTVTARALGVLHTATYDAWAAYDPMAKVTRPDGPLQQPKGDITPDNKKKAISWAAYQVLLDLFPSRTADFAAQMAELTYPIDGTDKSTAVAVGTQAARAVLKFRHNDNSNQTLNTNGTADPKDDTVTYPYPACTDVVTTNCYSPKNDWNKVNNPSLWQPLCVLTAKGVADGYPPVRDPKAASCADSTTPSESHYTLQQALTPQWGKVTPFASLSAIQYKVPAPPLDPDGSYSRAEIERALADSTNLDDAAKVKAEYWADGPRSEFPPGHAAVFAQALSRKRGHSLDTDVQLFFALGNAMQDASIAAWREKYKWDCVRPVSAIRNHYSGDITSWLGPGQNPSFGPVPAARWMPFQALNVVTPPFPEYVSGHSTFTAASSKIFLGFTGSDAFNASVTIPAGKLQIDPGVPAKDVTLSWPTFSAAADEAGMSRRYGGIHFISGDIHGGMLGASVGSNAWSMARAYIKGYAGTPGS